MREIKFRVWDKIEKRYYGYESKTMDLYYSMINNAFYFDNDQVDIGNINIVIEQYTGLKDKNGVEIYEGDICKIDLNNYGVKKCNVIYREDLMTFVFDNPKEVYFIAKDCILKTHIEVIGNIHEK